MFAVFVIIAAVERIWWVAVAGLLAAGVLFSCSYVVLEWERSAVLRFGKFNRVAGPGLIFM